MEFNKTFDRPITLIKPLVMHKHGYSKYKKADGQSETVDGEYHEKL